MKKSLILLLLFLSTTFSCAVDPEMMEVLMEIKAQNEKLLQEVEKMKSQLDALDGKYQVILGSLADNKKELEALKAQINALKAQLTQQLEKINQLSAQLEVQGADIEKLTAEIEELKASCDELKALMEELLAGRSPIPTNGLVAWYPFNGNANDESGNGYDGTIYGAISGKNRFNEDSKALSFDGINDLVDSDKSLDVSVNFSISVWAKPLMPHQIDPESNNQICCVYSGGSGQNYIMSPIHGAEVWGSNEHAGMGISMGTNGVSIYEHRAFHQPALLVWASQSPLVGWTHIVVNYVNNRPSLFINGVFVKEGLPSIQKFVHPSIGNPVSGKTEGIGGGLNQFFQGDIDELAIWNRALTGDEISKIYRGEKF